MIAGAHLLFYSKDPEADRAFFKTVLEFPSIDFGEGWLISALPPAELAVHPGDGEFVQMHAEHPMLGAFLYLMCDDLGNVNRLLKGKGVDCATPVELTGQSVRVFDCRVEAKRSLPTDSSHDDRSAFNLKKGGASVPNFARL